VPAFRLARFRKFELEIEQARILKEILDDASDAEPLIRSPLSKPGDPLKLRGVPIVGQGGIGGAIRGTQPEQAAMRPLGGKD
jgi:hypothetical protein